MKTLLCAAALVLVVATACDPTPGVNDRTPGTAKDSLSYAIGLSIAKNIDRDSLDLDLQMLLSGIVDEQAKKSLFADSVIQQVFMRLQQAQVEKANKAKAANSEQARKAGDEYRAKNGARNGVQTTSSGLQFEVIKLGTGPKPTAESTVRVHYTGTLVDGKVFDSSVQRGEPAEFGLNQVIPAWTEALLMMPVGSKVRIVAPSNLAYGDTGFGEVIPPGATLIFDIELLDIVKK